MAEQITYSINNYAEIELAELAKLSVDIWNAKGNQYNVERFTNWLKRLEYSIEPQIILAKRNDSLIGWAMLFAHSKTELEFNPFALGGHPIIHPDENIEEITNQILTETQQYFQKSKFTRIELMFNKEGSTEEQLYKQIYATHNYKLLEQICHMRMALDKRQILSSNDSNTHQTKQLAEVDTDELYKCFYATFRDTEDRMMISLSDEELKDYFETRVTSSAFKLVDNCSLVLLDKNDIIGFSVVRESHGQNNGNLWEFGIHP
ncbi:MAG: hypothetical protein ACTSSH_02905, partial [Candidatus Heimdallarchaeota archaeon]